MINDRKYVYYVQCRIGSNTWLTQFLITCSSVDRILPMLNEAGLDNITAYCEPKEPNIDIHHVQKFAKCRSSEQVDSIIEMYRVYCDIKPNELF